MGPSVPLEDEATGVYKIEITETPTGNETYYIEMTQDLRKVRNDTDPPTRKPDVSVVVASTDLAAILDGSLSPLQVREVGLGRTHNLGCQMVYFQNKKSDFLYILEGLGMEKVGIVNILWPFGICYGHLVQYMDGYLLHFMVIW
jgi:hypothetical protein